MVVVIDAFYYNKPRGFGRYIRELVFSITNCSASSVRFIIYIPRTVQLKDLIVHENVSYEYIPNVPFPLWEQFIFPFYLKTRMTGENIIVHHPYNTKPILFPDKRLKHIVTLHDLTFLDFKGDSFYQKVGALYRTFCTRFLSSKNCDLITVSNASKEDIYNKLGLKSFPIYTSVERFISEGVDADYLKQIGQERFFLHIGGVSSHKNSSRAIEAFISSNVDLKLFVIGLPSDCEIALKFRMYNKIVFPGWVTDGQVNALLASAQALVFPSLKEGYGLPIVEAFALGCPVITSDIDPMREVAGGAALLVDPFSESQLSEAYKMLSTDEHRADYVSRGYNRFADFSSESMGRNTLNFYKQVSERL
jgi:glycosyltransferase involved in cell wall biosynthesis